MKKVSRTAVSTWSISNSWKRFITSLLTCAMLLLKNLHRGQIHQMKLEKNILPVYCVHVMQILKSCEDLTSVRAHEYFVKDLEVLHDRLKWAHFYEFEKYTDAAVLLKWSSQHWSVKQYRRKSLSLTRRLFTLLKFFTEPFKSNYVRIASLPRWELSTVVVP